MSDISPINPSSPAAISTDPLYLQNARFEALPQSIKDQYLQSNNTLQLNVLFPVGTPTLLDPTYVFNDSALFFSATLDATTQFGQSLQAQELADQRMRAIAGLAAASEALVLGLEFEALDKAQAAAQSAATIQATNLQSAVTAAATATTNQQTNITTFNAGNSANKTAYSTLSAAYTAMTTALNGLGATITNGSYTVPTGKSAAYAAAIATYHTAVLAFNSSMASRSTVATTYNNTTTPYNTAATNTNANITAQIAAAQLGPYLTINNINLLQTPVAVNPIDTSIYSSQNAPPASAADGTTVTIPSLPAYITTFAANGPPIVSSLPSYTGSTGLPDTTIIQPLIYLNISAAEVNAAQQNLTATENFIAFLGTQASVSSLLNTIQDPLLNTQRLANRILPNSITNATTPTTTPPAGGANAVAASAIGVSNSHILGILAGDNLRQVIRNSQLSSNDPQHQSALTTQFLTLLVGLISGNSQNALLPSLGVLANNLATLPATSPALSVLFALSFANRVIEGAAPDGSTSAAVTAFINANPALQGLTTDQVAQVTAALNLGQTLLAIKLLETNLGLPGLSSQLLLPLVSPELAQAIVAYATTQNQQTQANLQALLVQNFEAQGFASPEATFLAQTGVELSSQTLTPTPTTTSADTANSTLLQDSVTASILLSGQGSIDLAQAQTAATTAIADVNAENAGQSNVSTNTFRSQLEDQLRQQEGISSTVAINAALDAVIIPSTTAILPSPVAIASTNETPPPPYSPTTPTPTPTPDSTAPPPQQLTQGELQSYIQTQLSQLLTPQLGIDLTNQVTEAVALSLFGNPHPDSSTIADVKSPNSIVNVVSRQIETLIRAENNTNDTALADSFSSTIQNSTDLYSFLIRAMDPAFLYAYSSDTGIMYSRPTSQPGVSQSRRQSIDIGV